MDHKTPVKSSLSSEQIHDVMELTPSTPLGRSTNDPTDLVGSLSALKINHGTDSALGSHHDPDSINNNHIDYIESTITGRAKRHFSERFTVEGSPFIGVEVKRRDILPTPAKVSFQIDGIEEEGEFSAMSETQKLPFDVASIPVNSTNITSHSILTKKILVICSASDEHDTGNHQENALRTALICGPEGCLRRKALLDFIEWLDIDGLSSPPISDLLRVHEFEYLDHLEKKCGKEVNHLPYFYAPHGLLDTDTPLVSHSYDAAKRFCRYAQSILSKHYLQFS